MTAAEALTALRRSQPHVWLSDIAMPTMDGYMLLQQVRALLPEQGGTFQQSRWLPTPETLINNKYCKLVFNNIFQNQLQQST
jgi:CheY-like chemotaxis protein